MKKPNEQPLPVDEMEDWLLCTCRLLVDHPEKVVVTAVRGPAGVAYHVEVAPDDMRRVIGRQGSTVGAVRWLLGCIGKGVAIGARLEIVEPAARFL